MSEASVIVVEDLAKRYIIGREVRHDTLRDRLSHGLGSLLRRRAAEQAAEEEFWALRDVSFEVKRGEVVGVIGRNGAGKSTLLKILSRITEPSRGRITLRGRVASLLEVGTGFHPELTGRENIFLNGAILGMSRVEIRKKFDEIVSFAEVERFLDTPVKRYSSGMYVRLAFAVAAHLEPEILIVDEVLAVGDAAFQEKCLGRMREVARGGERTVLFVSHQLTSVARVCSRAILLERGAVASLGPCANVLADYLRGHGTQIAEADLAALPRSGSYPQTARFVSARIPSSPDWTVRFGAPVHVSVQIACQRGFPDLELSFFLLNAYGVEVISTISSWNRNPGPFPAGVHSVEIRLPELNLAPGTYSAHLGIRSALCTEDFLSHALTFRILESTEGHLRNAEQLSGCLLSPASFVLSPPA